jgi:hypothetical protein
VGRDTRTGLQDPDEGSKDVRRVGTHGSDPAQRF